jgi:hypothetical protein
MKRKERHYMDFHINTKAFTEDGMIPKKISVQGEV